MKYILYFKDVFGEGKVHNGFYTSESAAQKAVDKLQKEERGMEKFTKIGEVTYFSKII